MVNDLRGIKLGDEINSQIILPQKKFSRNLCFAFTTSLSERDMVLNFMLKTRGSSEILDEYLRVSWFPSSRKSFIRLKVETWTVLVGSFFISILNVQDVQRRILIIKILKLCRITGLIIKKTLEIIWQRAKAESCDTRPEKLFLIIRIRFPKWLDN